MNARFYDILNHSFYILFIVFCVLFYKERMFDMDAANYAWHLTNYSDYFIPHDRWVNYITQSPALFAIHQGYSLKTVLIIYSATFSILYYLLFLLFRYLILDPKSALIPTLALLFAIRYKHYAGHTEIVVAIYLASLWCAFIVSKRFHTIKPILKWAIISLLLIAASLTHPIILIPLVGFWMLDFLFKKDYWNKQQWFLLISILLIFGIRFYYAMLNPYESKKIASIDTMLSIMIEPTKFDSVKIMVKYMLTDYLPVLALIFFALYFLRKQSNKLFYWGFLAANLGLFLLIATAESYLRGDIYFLIDGYLGMFGLLWAYPIFRYLKNYNQKEFKYALMVVLIICSSQIVSKSSFFLQRLDHFRSIIKANQDSSKYYIDSWNHNWDEMWYPYFIPLEMLMLTALEGKQYCKTLYVNYDNLDLTEKLKKEDIFLFFNGSIKQENLNPLYYELPKEPYKKLDNVPWK